jgi:hypothetical protein
LKETLKGERPLEKSRHRLEDNFKMDVKEMKWEDLDLNYLA